MYDEWLGLLAGIDAPYVLVETADLWGMTDPTTFEAFLVACARTFEDDDPRDWAVMLDQTVSMHFDVLTEHIYFEDRNPAPDLRGYEWVRPVPWLE